MMMKKLTLTLTIVFSGFVAHVQSLRFIQQPQTQHAVIGRNLTFSCVTDRPTDVTWHAIYLNGTEGPLTPGTVGVFIKRNENNNNQITAAVTITATQSWNGTSLQCYAASKLSDSAYIMVYISLRPLPPSQLQIVSTTTSTLIVSWSPTLFWEDYDHIDYYNISIGTKGNSSFLSLRSVQSTNFTYFSDHIHPPCTKFEFNITAVSRLHGESDESVIVGGFDSSVDSISQELFVIINVYFRANGSPIVDVIIQLPMSVCSYQYITVNSSVFTADSGQGMELIHSELSTSQGPGNVTSSVNYGLLKDQNYTLKVTIASARGSSFRSTFTNFDTNLLVKPPNLVCSKSLKADKDILHYKIAIGVCLVVVVIICLTFVVVVVCLCGHNKRRTNKLKINDSTSRVCNAMVHNPIYDGPVYESVQPQFETLTKQATSTSNTSACNSQSSTPTTSEKSIHYVDPPSSAQQKSKTRSKSFLSHPPPREGNTENIPRSTSVSVPVIKKQRNVLNLRLTLPGFDSSAGTTGTHNAKNSTAEPVSAVNPVVLRDVDDNYTVMSPVTGRSALACMAEWSELSPEDTDKYKE